MAEMRDGRLTFIGTTSTVYLFFSHDGYDKFCGYSLFGMDISMSTTAGEECWEVKPPYLLVRLPLPHRQHLVCAKLGTKFYFLGGFIPADNGLTDFPQYALPPDVLVYDPTDPANNEKDPVDRVVNGKRMFSGKILPLTFEANEKLYVLGGCPPIPGVPDDEFWLFEEYDPVTSCWAKLPLPPFRDADGHIGNFSWHSSFVVSPERVLISGTFEDIIMFSFNPLTCEWLEVIRPSIKIHFHSLFVEDSFYGILVRDIVTKFGPSSRIKDGELLGLPYFPRPVVDWGSFSSSGYPIRSDAVICHLGNRCFCIMQTVPDLSDMPMPNRYNWLLKVIVHKELQEDPTCFKLKCLHQVSFPITTKFTSTTEFSTVDVLTSCHVISSEEQNKRIQVGDKKAETKLEEKTKKKKKKKKKKKNKVIVIR